MHNPIASWAPLVASSGESHIPAVNSGLPLSWSVFIEQCHRTLLGAFSGHLTSTLDVVCPLLTQPCWWYCPSDVQCSATMPSQWLQHVCATTCCHLSGMHRRWRRSITSWRLYFFSCRLTMIRRLWLYCSCTV